MGLMHTTESDGRGHDLIADTPECTTANDANGDGRLVSGECLSADGQNAMFWETAPDGAYSWSPTQIRVLKNSLNTE